MPPAVLIATRTSPRSSSAVSEAPTASVRLTCTFGRRFAYLARNTDRGLGCGCHFEDTRIGPSEKFSLFRERSHGTKDVVASPEKLLAFTSQRQAAPNAVKQCDPQARQ